MSEGKKYLRRTDTGLVLEIDPSLLAILRPFLDQAGISYEVLDAPPPHATSAPPAEGGDPQKRRK